MEKLFVPYHIAFALKEKGFDEKCFTFYWDDIGMYKDFQYGNHNKSENTVSAPIYQQVIDWFREKHKIIVDVRTIWINKAIGLSEISSYVPHCNHDINVEYDDYYKAFDIAIEKALEMI